MRKEGGEGEEEGEGSERGRKNTSLSFTHNTCTTQTHLHPPVGESMGRREKRNNTSMSQYRGNTCVCVPIYLDGNSHDHTPYHLGLVCNPVERFIVKDMNTHRLGRIGVEQG